MKRLKKLLSFLLCAAILTGMLGLLPALPSVSAAQPGNYTRQTNPGLTGSFGWEGDKDAPIAFIDGSYKLRDRGDLMVTFGVTGIPGKISWENKEGYLPCFVSSYKKDGLRHTVESFADEAVIGGNRFEIAYSRMTTVNTTDSEAELPVVSSALVPLNDAAKNTSSAAAGETVVRDYCIGADRFGGAYDYPTDDALAAQGSWDEHYTHMKNYWNGRLAGIFDIKKIPSGYEELINAYKAGYIYTLIVKDGTALHVGENGYDQVFDHDVIGMLATLVELGDTQSFQEYAPHILDHVQYPDARWKYSWPFALYLQKTGDTAYIESMFDTIKENTRYISTQRTGKDGIMMNTNAIDSNGSWLIDNWAALTGLTTYKYICEKLYQETGTESYQSEAGWAQSEYDLLLAAVESAQAKLRQANNYPYLSIAMDVTTEQSARKDPRDGNWASMFLFGRFAWDGYLFGADQEGSEMISLIDDTYAHGIDRRVGVSDSMYNFGGYPHGYYSSAYNAGYGSAALRGERYRFMGIKAYQWMIENSMSGPYSWWEGVAYPSESSPWDAGHASGGGGSCQHMWGQSVNTKVLLDSILSEKADGTLVVGRGLPKDWNADGEELDVANIPVNGGERVGVNLKASGKTVTFTLTSTSDLPVSLELPSFIDNIQSAGGLSFDSAKGVVTLPAGTKAATVELIGEMSREAPREEAVFAVRNALNGTDLLESIYYTVQSYHAFTDAVAEARALLSDGAATSRQLLDAAKAVTNAKNSLRSLDENMTGLDGARYHLKIFIMRTNYEFKSNPAAEASFPALTESLRKADEIIKGMDDYTEQQVNAAAEELEGYYNLLTAVGDADDLTGANAALFTPESLSSVQAALAQPLAQAKALMADAAANQKQAGLYALRLRKLLNGLQQAEETGGCNNYGTVTENTNGIALDGVRDAAYDGCVSIRINKPLTSKQDPTDSEGLMYLTKKDGYLYVFIEVQDSTLMPLKLAEQSTEPWNTDSVEVFLNRFDTDNFAYSYQYRVDYSGYQSTNGGVIEDYGPDYKGVYFDSMAALSDKGYNLEYKIPIGQTAKGQRLAVHAMLNDVLENGSVPHLITENQFAANTWSPQLFGYITLEDTEEAKKASLQQAIDYADGEKAKPEYEKVIPAAKAVLEAALETAVRLNEDLYAPQGEVDAAYLALIDAVHDLGLYQGDKAQLLKLINSADALDLTGYLVEGQAEFLTALAEAKKVYADENAVQDEVDAAAKALEIAVANLIPKADKYLLKQAIELAEGLDLSKYIQNGKAELAIELREAKKVYDNEAATKEQVAKATKDLNAAILALRRAANKENLAAVIEKAEALNAADYTPESFADVARALESANAMMADGSLSEDDQAQVDTAEAVLAAAIENLVKASGDTPDTPDDPKGDKTPTGDATPLLGLGLLTLFGGAALILCRRKAR